MASALPSLDGQPTYLDYFGMSRPPFARLSAPSEIFYSDQCSLLNTHLSSAAEQADSLVVVCGADGAGKTTLLNQYIAGLGDEVSFAVFDDTCVDGIQFYCSFLQQIGFGEVTGTLRELQRITREFLLHSGKAGDPVLFFVDNAHLVRPAVLEQLRWVADTKLEGSRVISIILGGNLNLPRIVDSPAMSSLKFRYVTNFHIRVYTEVETDDYVRHRLRLAGAADAAKFTDDSRALIYRFTGGIPSLINKLCNAVLTEACAEETRVINEQLIRSVADNHQILPHVVPIKGKSRRRTDPDYSVLISADDDTGERIAGRRHAPGPGGANKGSSQDNDDAESGQTQLAVLKKSLARAEGAAREAQLDIARRDQEIDELQRKLSKKTAAADELAATITNGAIEFEKLKAGLAEARALLKESTLTAQSSAAEIKDLQQQLAASDKAATTLQTELENLEARNEELEAQLTDGNTATDDSRKELQKQQAEIKALQEELSATSKQAEKFAAEAETRFTKDEKAAKEMAAEQKSLQKELSSKNKEAEKLKRAAEKTQKENKTLVTSLAASEKTLADRTKAVEQLTADLDKWEKSKSDEVISDLREQLAAKSKEYDELVADGASHDNDLEQLKSELGDFREQLKEQERTFKGLNTDLKKEQRAAKSAATKLGSSEKKVDELQHNNEELQGLIDMLNADIQSSDEQADKVESLQKKLDELQASLDEKDRTIGELQNDLAALESRSAAAPVASKAKKRARKPKKTKAVATAAKPHEGVAAIEVHRAGKRLQALETHDAPSRLMIGRAVDSDLRLNSKFVSRHHAFLFITADRIYIEDLNSSNGIVVNGKKVGTSDLQASDNIVIGDFTLQLVEG